MNETTPETQSFEEAMLELEALVSKIETGNLSLEDSLKEFEQGIKLSRVCQTALNEADNRVKILTSDSGVDGSDEQDFEIKPE